MWLPTGLLGAPSNSWILAEMWLLPPVLAVEMNTITQEYKGKGTHTIQLPEGITRLMFTTCTDLRPRARLNIRMRKVLVRRGTQEWTMNSCHGKFCREKWGGSGHPSCPASDGSGHNLMTVTCMCSCSDSPYHGMHSSSCVNLLWYMSYCIVG